MAVTPWRIHFFERYADDDAARAVPARDFLESCPLKVQAKMWAVLKAVADSPPPSFSGGGFWEAMHGDMSSYFEVRLDGPKRATDTGPKQRHYRLFCVLERDGKDLGLGGPSLVAICGKDKAIRTVLSNADYLQVRQLGSEYRKRKPRSVMK